MVVAFGKSVTALAVAPCIRHAQPICEQKTRRRLRPTQDVGGMGEEGWGTGLDSITITIVLKNLLQLHHFKTII